MILKDSDKFRFTPKGHKHEILIDGEWQERCGCTSVSGLFSDDGWKFAWPVKLMEEKLREYVYSDRYLSESQSRLISEIAKAKNAWREKRDKSADTGVCGHAWIEDIIKQEIYSKGTAFYTIPEDEEVANIASEFMDWESKTKPLWLASELQVGSLAHEYCGIADALAEINGKTVLIDFKTSGSVKQEYNIQLAGLALALEEMGVKIDERAILHLPKDGEYKYVPITTDLKWEQDAFLKGLAFLRMKNIFLSREDKWTTKNQ